MMTRAVVGANWGDEGKGRMVDLLSEDADAVIRYQGGNNAGHTVVNEFGTFKLNLLPSGVFRRSVTNVLGPGTVIDAESLAGEIDALWARGIADFTLLVSDRATVCFPYHRIEDAAEEERLGDGFFGSTKRGIAYAYGDRYLKKALTVADLLDEKHLERRLAPVVEWKNAVFTALYGPDHAVDLDEMVAWGTKWGARIEPYVTDVSKVLADLAGAGKTLIFEAQLGALRDISLGIYPYTSSSSSLAGFAGIGSGLPSLRLDRVTAVAKAFSTCVGEGPFVTEIRDGAADSFRETADEYGATTGRPRRIGHFDVVATHYGLRLQGATECALTKLDSLSGLEDLRICVAYELDGKELTDFPLPHQLDRCTPIYQQLRGWTADITGVRRFEDLPAEAQEYVLTIEALIGCPIAFVSVGPEREQIIRRA